MRADQLLIEYQEALNSIGALTGKTPDTCLLVEISDEIFADLDSIKEKDPLQLVAELRRQQEQARLDAEAEAEGKAQRLREQDEAEAEEAETAEYQQE